jgi:hypothetical protein
LTSSLDSYTIRSRKNMIFITDWTIRRLPRKVNCSGGLDCSGADSWGAVPVSAQQAQQQGTTTLFEASI